MLHFMGEFDSCRICLESLNEDDYPSVIRPCQCEILIHKKCLEEQLKKKFQTNCEICGKIYIFNLYNEVSISDLEDNSVNEILLSPSFCYKIFKIIIIVLTLIVLTICLLYIIFYVLGWL